MRKERRAHGVRMASETFSPPFTEKDTQPHGTRCGLSVRGLEEENIDTLHSSVSFPNKAVINKNSSKASVISVSNFCM